MSQGNGNCQRTLVFQGGGRKQIMPNYDQPTVFNRSLFFCQNRLQPYPSYHKSFILPTAYVLILLDYNYPDYEIMSQLDKLPCVIEVNKVGGPYDIVGKLFDNDTDPIKESIGKHMTKIKEFNPL